MTGCWSLAVCHPVLDTGPLAFTHIKTSHTSQHKLGQPAKAPITMDTKFSLVLRNRYQAHFEPDCDRPVATDLHLWRFTKIDILYRFWPFRAFAAVSFFKGPRQEVCLSDHIVRAFQPNNALMRRPAILAGSSSPLSIAPTVWSQ